MGLDLSASISVSGKMVSDVTADLGPVSTPLTGVRSVTLTDGALAGQANELYRKRRTIAASTSEDLDLSGVLLDPLGGAAVFVRIKGLFIAAAIENVNNVVVGAASSNAWTGLLNSTGTLTFRPGAAQLFLAGAADATGYAVTAGTADLLKVANSAGSTSVTYDIIIFGANA